MGGENMDIDQMMNPDKYGLKQCPNCNGYGSSLKESSDRCSQCDGTGLVKK
jgi:DnaJ-class molecular chaperone